MFHRILIANRGEIDVRVIRTCRELEVETVAVYSTADADALHVKLATEAVCIGPPKAADSYLNMSALLTAALETGCDAIHPGYGFLSENPEFADLCRQCGLKFIGPSGDVIRQMGNKAAARALMRSHGVPVVPGSEGPVSGPEEAAEIAEKIGYPVLLKASSGGGGRGMRRVDAPEELPGLYAAAQAEAVACFGDGELYVEKLILHPRHIEFQILADSQGNVVHLGERECSIQKRNQKLLEEAPSPAISPELREKMCEAASKAAKAAGYTNAGTVEFLLDDENHFYFMEMNTRLQVEHPVSEYVSGVDIVKWQIRIACGVLLNFRQEDVKITGAAIECRINAKSGGKVTFLHVPGGPWVRFDTFLYQGYEMLPYYDSMMGKLIVYAKTREETKQKMNSALCELVIEGVPNNLDEQLEIISDPAFLAGDYHTDFMAKRGE